MAIIIYLAIPLFMGLLYLMSGDEEVPKELQKGGLQEAFGRIAAYLYRRFLCERRLFKVSAYRRRVQEDLRTLNSRANVREELKAYYIGKISMVLLVITCGALLSAAAYISTRTQHKIADGNEVLRGDYEKRSEQMELTARGMNGEDYGEFELEVESRIYTKPEAEKLYAEMCELLPEMIRGENESLSHVNCDLSLPSGVAGYPFEISWDSDNSTIINSKGEVNPENAEKDGTKMTLTAKISYLEMNWVKEIDVTVCPIKLTGVELIRKTIRDDLMRIEETTREKPGFFLPPEAEGVELIWGEKVEDNSPKMMLLVVVAAVLIYIAKDKELSKEVAERKRMMILEYPQFVSRLVLYMGAGMSVRGILQHFAREYKKEKEGFGRISFLYEEIVRSCNELESGVPELSVYERFGIRCGSQQYTRLVTLLSQNLKKGNSELVNLLREESEKATQERMSYARKLGEEAGTKLLVPMMLMLLIVMVVIMIPAYLSF